MSKRIKVFYYSKPLFIYLLLFLIFSSRFCCFFLQCAANQRIDSKNYSYMSSFNLRRAYNAALQTVVGKGKRTELLKKYDVTYKELHVCPIVVNGTAEFPLIKDLDKNDMLRNILIAKEIDIGTLYFNFGSVIGDYTLDIPYGFFPDLLREIIKEISRAYKTKIKINYVKSEAVEEIFEDLEAGYIHMTDIFMIYAGITADGKPRSYHFDLSCPVVASGIYLYVLKNTGIHTIRDLQLAIKNSNKNEKKKRLVIIASTSHKEDLKYVLPKRTIFYVTKCIVLLLKSHAIASAIPPMEEMRWKEKVVDLRRIDTGLTIALGAMFKKVHSTDFINDFSHLLNKQKEAQLNKTSGINTDLNVETINQRYPDKEKKAANYSFNFSAALGSDEQIKNYSYFSFNDPYYLPSASLNSSSSLPFIYASSNVYSPFYSYLQTLSHDFIHETSDLSIPSFGNATSSKYECSQGLRAAYEVAIQTVIALRIRDKLLFKYDLPYTPVLWCSSSPSAAYKYSSVPHALLNLSTYEYSNYSSSLSEDNKNLSNRDYEKATFYANNITYENRKNDSDNYHLFNNTNSKELFSSIFVDAIHDVLRNKRLNVGITECKNSETLFKDNSIRFFKEFTIAVVKQLSLIYKTDIHVNFVEFCDQEDMFKALFNTEIHMTYSGAVYPFVENEGDYRLEKYTSSCPSFGYKACLIIHKNLHDQVKCFSSLAAYIRLAQSKEGKTIMIDNQFSSEIIRSLLPKTTKYKASSSHIHFITMIAQGNALAGLALGSLCSSSSEVFKKYDLEILHLQHVVAVGAFFKKTDTQACLFQKMRHNVAVASKE